MRCRSSLEYIYRRWNAYPRVASMWRIFRARTQRGGVLLDAILAVGLILLAAFALEELGVSFGEILQQAARFFGL
jgi:hypothetical protein